MKRLAPLLVVAAVLAGLTASTVTADIPPPYRVITPECFLDSEGVYTNAGIAAGWGRVHCYAFGNDWGGDRWNVVFCIQVYIRNDSSWSNGNCVYDSSIPQQNQGKATDNLLPNVLCRNYGHNEFRIRGTLDWLKPDGVTWDRKQDTGPVSWNC